MLPYRARRVAEQFDKYENHMNLMAPWRPQSPDINPIERLWEILDWCVQQSSPPKQRISYRKKVFHPSSSIPENICQGALKLWLVAAQIMCLCVAFLFICHPCICARIFTDFLYFQLVLNCLFQFMVCIRLSFLSRPSVSHTRYRLTSVWEARGFQLTPT